MNIKIIIFCLLAGLVGGCVTQPNVKGDLVFLGTVAEMTSSPLPQSRLGWVVQCEVDRVVSGTFPGKTFSFRIHSPSKSGLEVGKQYTITATRTPDGFHVDQHQWMNTLNKALDDTSQ